MKLKFWKKSQTIVGVRIVHPPVTDEYIIPLIDNPIESTVSVNREQISVTPEPIQAIKEEKLIETPIPQVEKVEEKPKETPKEEKPQVAGERKGFSHWANEMKNRAIMYYVA